MFQEDVFRTGTVSSKRTREMGDTVPIFNAVGNDGVMSYVIPHWTGPADRRASVIQHF
jgi:hypothetical protein